MTLRSRHGALFILLFGCSEPSNNNAEPDLGQSGGPIIDHTLWEAVAAGSDPFDDRPATVECERGVGWDVELLDADQTVSVQTNDCNYLGITQPLLRAIATGERLAVQLWHFQLVGDGPAHAAISINEVVVWEQTISIPSDSGLTIEEFEVPDGAAAGAPIVFHLHNHGLNSWNLVRIGVAD